MTTVSQASAHQPPSLHASVTPLPSLKRRASVISSDKSTGKPLTPSGEETRIHKRRHRPATGSAPLSAPPPLSFASPPANQSSTSPQLYKYSRARDGDGQPLEVVDGFILGSETTQNVSVQTPLPGRSSPPALPRRPWKHRSRPRNIIQDGLNNSGVRRRTDLYLRWDSSRIESPRTVPKFMKGRLADFEPWLGNHPEDVLNDQNVKNGFIDRIPVLHALSALFASVVEERQTHSKISSCSVFKPPPRVTLTEAKRKAWLVDLANQHVSIRKLSRTIPQGIRGQSLLDQCFLNHVPIGRALWFVKCVGANEIRTLKRKGSSATFVAGSEIKWLREWTANVEQFLETGIDQCSQPDFRSRLNYALRLTVRLYSESLLDRDHYLDWIVKSTSFATLDNLPVWLLMANLHRADLVQHRKRGRLLAECLLEKLQTAIESGGSSLQSLVGKMKHILSLLIHTNPACFVMPQKWSKYREIVAECLDLHTSTDALLELAFKNERLSTVLATPLSESRNVQRLLIGILDAAVAPFKMDEIAQDCRSACHDIALLVNIILEWCTSPYRVGKYRVSLGVRLLSMWQDGNDINSAVIAFLASQHGRLSCDIGCLRQLVFELVRARVMSLGKYLQWLIARGGLKRPSPSTPSFTSPAPIEAAGLDSQDRTGLEPTEVLTAVPLSTLSPAVKNLRDILLRRAGFSLDDESALLSSCKEFVSAQLPRIFRSCGNEPSDKPPSAPNMSDLSWSIRFEIGRFIQRNLESCRVCRDGSTRDDLLRDSKVQNSTFYPTGAEFCTLRGVLEELGELNVLADLVERCASSGDERLLASATDTVNFHLNEFSALGALTHLHQHVFQSYLSMRADTGLLPRQFTLSLISLGSAAPSNLVSTSSLQQDLARGDRSHVAIAACSPVSDGMAESLNQAGSNFVDEVEAVLSSGNRMEAQTMTQLFKLLSERLEKAQHPGETEKDDILFTFLARLKIYRMQQFDALVAEWLKKLVTTEKSNVVFLLPTLISTGCVSLEASIEILLEALTAQRDGHSDAFATRSHAAGFLEMLVDAEKATDSIAYKLKLENSRYSEQHPERVLNLQADVGLSAQTIGIQFSNYLLIHLVLKGRGLDTLSSSTAKMISSRLDDLLQLPGHATVSTFSDLVSKTTELSQPFCLLRLHLWDISSSDLPGSPEQGSIIATLLELAQDKSDDRWVSYMTAISHDTARQIRGKAEEAFFALPLFHGAGPSSSLVPVASSMDQASGYMMLVSRAAQRTPCTGKHALVTMLVERFAVVLRGLVTGKSLANSTHHHHHSDDNDNDGNNNNHKMSKGVGTQSAVFDQESAPENLNHLVAYIELLLHMTSINRDLVVPSRPDPISSPIATTSHRPTQQEVAKLLVLMTNIALHPSLDLQHRRYQQNPPPTQVASHIFDVAATIVDDISDDLRIRCARILKDKLHDPRVQYLFGTASFSKGIVVSSTFSSPVPGDAATSAAPELGLQLMTKDGRRAGEYRMRNWEMLNTGGGGGGGGAEANSSISLSLFGARRKC